jgi:hypothetical protein
VASRLLKSHLEGFPYEVDLVLEVLWLGRDQLMNSGNPGGLVLNHNPFDSRSGCFVFGNEVSDLVADVFDSLLLVQVIRDIPLEFRIKEHLICWDSARMKTSRIKATSTK